MKKIIGYNNSEISVKEQNDYQANVGIIYPGQSYYLTAPSLFYLQPIFEKFRIHYYGVDTQYGNNEIYKSSSLQDKDKWLDTDSTLIGDFVLNDTIKYKTRIFVAKSLGTGHLYNQLRNNYINKKDILIFQTPVIPYDELQDLLIKKENKSLIIYGTNDSIMLKNKFNRIQSKMNTEVIEIENAGHSFEEENKVEESINNLKNVMLGTERFLAKVLPM